MEALTIYGLLQREPEHRRTWLSFDRAPPTGVRRQLRAAGWTFTDAGRGWMYPSLRPPLPRGVVFAAGRDCRYSSVGAGRPAEVLAVLRRALVLASRRARPPRTVNPPPRPGRNP